MFAAFPEPWAFDNFALLLLMSGVCGEMLIAERLRLGHMHESACIINCLVTVRHFAYFFVAMDTQLLICSCCIAGRR